MSSISNTTQTPKTVTPSSFVYMLAVAHISDATNFRTLTPSLFSMLQVDLSYMMRESKKKTAAPTSALPTTPATASKKGQN